MIMIKDEHAIAMHYSEEIIQKLVIIRSNWFNIKQKTGELAKRYGFNFGIRIRKDDTILKPTKTKREKNWFLDIETFTRKIDIVKKKQYPYLICIISEEGERYSFFGENCIMQLIQFIRDVLIKDKYVQQTEEEKNEQEDEDDEQEEEVKEEKQKRIKIQHVIWAFNGAKFDFVFLFPDFIQYFKADCVGEFSNIKQMSFDNIEFLDFRNIFAGRLNTLSKDWLGKEKIEFDHGIVNEDSLSSLEFQNKSIEYCYMDCQLLLEIFMKYKEVLIANGIYKSSFMTATQLTYNYFKSQMKDNQIIEGLPSNQYNFLKSSYFGGMTMNLKQLVNETIYYYDINSSYPYIMKNNKMPVKSRGDIGCFRVVHRNSEKICDDKLYMVTEFKWKDDTYIPFFPVRADGKSESKILRGLYYPIHAKEWNQYRWGFEINKGFEVGWLEFIEVTNCYEFEMKDIFSEYITNLYDQRVKAKHDKNVVGSVFYKNLMNSLYGKFAQRLFNKAIYCTSAVTKEILLPNQQQMNMTVNHVTDNIDRVEFDEDNYKGAVGSCVQISSYITAKARMALVDIFKHNPRDVCYMDTDSVITTTKLPEHMVDENILGKVKLEGVWDKGLFLGAKMYYLEKGDKFVAHMKGVHTNNLTDQKKVSEYFNIILNQGSVQFTNENTFKKYFGYVQIEDVVKNIHCIERRKFNRQTYDSIPLYELPL